MNTFVPGQLVYWREEAAVLVEIKGLTDAIIRTLETGLTEVVRVTDLARSPAPDHSVGSPHLLKKSKEWDKIVQRFEIIRPLIERKNHGIEDVRAVAEEAGKSIPTIYRWMRRYNSSGLVSSLARSKRIDKGTQRLSEELENIIDEQIHSFYLKEERPSVASLNSEIGAICDERGVRPPHINTIYSRVKQLDREVTVGKRFSAKKVKDDLTPHRGKFPGADYPNAVVQIDHTPVDVIIVDEEHRLPIGRPYLTIAIDVATKMLTGFRLTLEHPSALSAGLCIAHAVQRKNDWLAKRDILADWPIHGKMTKIHVDNAKEFQSKMLERACEQHNIILEFRPRNQPNYGPHVERAFRTYMQEVQTIPGTTFSNVKSRMRYDSNGKACMTLEELELWFTVFIVYRYHHKKHSGINKTPPIKLYNSYVHGTDTMLGVGLPAVVQDEETFRLDFTPYVERTIQQDGALVNHIHYYSPILRKWIGDIDPSTKKCRKFIFAYDPIDISVIYFLDPDTHSYVPIPYLNNTRPAISLWELKASLDKIKEAPLSQVNEDSIFKGVRIMRNIVDTAIEKTRLAKQRRATEKRNLRMKERRKHWSEVHKPPSGAFSQDTDTYSTESNNGDDAIQPFDNIEIGKLPK